MSQQRRAKQQHEHAARPARKLRLSLESILWIGVLLLFLYRVAPQASAALGTNSDGAAAPAVSFEMLDGAMLELQQLRGKVVLVNFWATWCPPCRFEIPGFERVYQAKKDQGFVVVGLSADEGPRSVVVDFLRERNITYPVGIATNEAQMQFGGFNGLPTSFLIDRAGRVRYRVSGIFSEVALRQAVDRLLAER